MRDEQVEKIIKANMNLQMNLAGIRVDFEEAMQRKPLTLEAVYETIIHWDEGGGKRSRRELARRIVELAAHSIGKENT